MARYYLRNPKNSADILTQKGQNWDEPIYKSHQGNDYYLLRMDAHGARWLIEYDANTRQCLASQSRVNDDWHGEPMVIGIERSTFGNLEDLCARGDINAQRVWADIVAKLIEGDILRITENGRTIAKVHAEQSRKGIELVVR